MNIDTSAGYQPDYTVYKESYLEFQKQFIANIPGHLQGDVKQRLINPQHQGAGNSSSEVMAIVKRTMSKNPHLSPKKLNECIVDILENYCSYGQNKSSRDAVDCAERIIEGILIPKKSQKVLDTTSEDVNADKAKILESLNEIKDSYVAKLQEKPNSGAKPVAVKVNGSTFTFASGSGVLRLAGADLLREYLKLPDDEIITLVILDKNDKLARTNPDLSKEMKYAIGYFEDSVNSNSNGQKLDGDFIADVMPSLSGMKKLYLPKIS